jgi:precorrin-3B synthase
MESGDGLLVRIPIKFGKIHSDVARSIVSLSTKYGNGHFDLSARGNLQLRGVQPETYVMLREGLAELGFVQDFSLHVIANPLDKNAQEFVEKLLVKSVESGICLPEKFLIVIDGDGVFPLSALPCDLYIKSEQADVSQILSALQNIKKCAKKPADEKMRFPELGFIPLSERFDAVNGVISIAAPFGRLKAEELNKLAAISDRFGNGELIFAPFRRVILPNIAENRAEDALHELKTAGFIVNSNDSRLNIYACVGAPSCSSAFADTRNLAQKWADDFPNLTKIVHITGCSKGCAYRGIADITITATATGYETSYDNLL